MNLIVPLFVLCYRWGFATHGCVDGFSRVIVFLRCCTANTAEQVATSFIAACNKYGLPHRVRSDHGLENFNVGILMNILRGQNRGSIITGKSVHNQRIERLWRDVFKEVVSTFYSEFYAMEDAGILVADDPLHRCALQLSYLPSINARLGTFQNAWNNHSVRTEGHCTPEQLWLSGTLEHANTSHTDEILCEGTPSVHQRIIQYCSQYVDVNAVAGASDYANGWHGDDITLSQFQLDELNNVLSTATSDHARYETCLLKLRELLS